MTQTKATFDPKPLTEPLPKFPAHYSCRQAPNLIVLALNNFVKIGRVSSQDALKLV